MCVNTRFGDTGTEGVLLSAWHTYLFIYFSGYLKYYVIGFLSLGGVNAMVFQQLRELILILKLIELCAIHLFLFQWIHTVFQAHLSHQAAHIVHREGFETLRTQIMGSPGMGCTEEREDEHAGCVRVLCSTGLDLDVGF